MRRLSIITAAYGPLASYFAETVRSVAEQRMPSDWDLEWLVQEDGKTPSLEGIVSAIPFARYSANLAHTGIAATRNLALTRATGDVIAVLDHDDVLLPDAFTHLLPHFDEPNVHWIVGQADDLLPDGTRRAYESALPIGPISAGQVNDWALTHGGNWPIHCAGTLVRTTVARAVGGWGGVPIDDDVIMISAITELTSGYNAAQTTWLYRIHERQTSLSASWRERGSDGRRIAAQRVEALRIVRATLAGDLTATVPNIEVDRVSAKESAAGGAAWWRESA